MNVRGKRAGVFRYLMLIFPIIVIASCSGMVDKPEDAVKKTVRAYGGPQKVELLRNYLGKGFMKDLTSTSVAKSHPLDVYQKGRLFKSSLYRLYQGKLTDVMVLYYDGHTSYQWMNKQGRREITGLGIELVDYKFPLVLTWIQEPGRTGEILPGDDEHTCRLQYQHENDLITLTLDTKSWLLKEVEIVRGLEYNAVYNEAYDNYREVDGIPFPSRFTGKFLGKVTYEFLISLIEIDVDLPDSLFQVTVDDTLGLAKSSREARP